MNRREFIKGTAAALGLSARHCIAELRASRRVEDD